MTDYAYQAKHYLVLIEGEMREAITFHLEGMAEDGEATSSGGGELDVSAGA
jgi:hypothetical protein